MQLLGICAIRKRDVGTVLYVLLRGCAYGVLTIHHHVTFFLRIGLKTFGLASVEAGEVDGFFGNY